MTETELMPRLLVGYTELSDSKLKTGKGILEPNFGVGPNPEKSHGSDKCVRAKDAAIQISQVQRFLGSHAAVSNLLNLGRHLVRAEHNWGLRVSAVEEWGSTVA